MPSSLPRGSRESASGPVPTFLRHVLRQAVHCRCLAAHSGSQYGLGTTLSREVAAGRGVSPHRSRRGRPMTKVWGWIVTAHISVARSSAEGWAATGYMADLEITSHALFRGVEAPYGVCRGLMGGPEVVSVGAVLFNACPTAPGVGSHLVAMFPFRSSSTEVPCRRGATVETVLVDRRLR